MSEEKTIKIGTRSSDLATWQANTVAHKLQTLGYQTKIIFISSAGDQDRSTPLWKMGGKGVFTKALDEALLRNEIDVAVHSYKDLPTDNPLPLKVAAVLERGDPRDTLVARTGTDFLDDPAYEATIATGSNRRKAQWLARYPQHRVVPLRGNVNTRLEKIEQNSWDGAIFAAAGLLRINLEEHISRYLDWMISAPAQAAVAVMIRGGDEETESIVANLNHQQSDICTAVERTFLNKMEAGCSSPVGAYARYKDDKIHFKAVVLAHDGSERLDFEREVLLDEADDLGNLAAQQLLQKGAGKFIGETE